MQVAFRVDASAEMGTGHVMRCLTLASRLANGGASCVFVMRELEGNLIGHVRASGYDVVALPPPMAASSCDDEAPPHASWLGVDWRQDAEESAAALAGRTVAWLVVDHYALDARWHRQLRPRADRILVIDDLADRPLDCDALVNQSPVVSEGSYQTLLPSHCEQMLGLRYAMLRPEFVAAQRDRVDLPASRVLVFLGGSDPGGGTLTTLTSLEQIRWDHPGLGVDVVIGSANPHAAAIVAWCAARPWATPHVSGADMRHLMDLADVGVGAGGMTIWERCARGLPSVIVTIAANQRPGAQFAEAAGAAIYAGDLQAISSEELGGALRRLLSDDALRQRMQAAARALVDGGGIDRISAVMQRPSLSLRRATAADCDAMWRWRNAESTRRYFRNPDAVDLDRHREWFSASLGLASRDLLIAESADGPVGVLRFDHADGTAEVSIYLVPGLQGRGFGTGMLKAGMTWLAQHRPETRHVDAEVLEANVASQRAFRAAGFQPSGTRYRRTLARDRTN